MESTLLLGMKRVRQFVGKGPATEILDSLIDEARSEYWGNQTHGS
jgi:hypothetical protein